MFFCARLQNGTQKKYWKPNSSVLLSTLWILPILFIFLAFLLLSGLVSNISEVCLERCDSYSDFGYLTKNQTPAPLLIEILLALFSPYHSKLKYYWQQHSAEQHFALQTHALHNSVQQQCTVFFFIVLFITMQSYIVCTIYCAENTVNSNTMH